MAFSPFSAGEFTQTENPRKCLISRRLAETKQPTDGKAVNGLREKRWSERRDSNSRPFDPQSNALNQAALRSDLIFDVLFLGKTLINYMEKRILQIFFAFFLVGTTERRGRNQ